MIFLDILLIMMFLYHHLLLSQDTLKVRFILRYSVHESTFQIVSLILSNIQSLLSMNPNEQA